MNEGSEQKSAVAKSFGENAAGYLSSKNHSEGEDLVELAEWCADARWALDIATGAGHTAGALLDVGVRNVIGFDAAPEMVATSTEAYPGILGVVGDAERLPFRSNRFDAVTCRIAAHHFPSPERFVTEASRVVKPGGVFALEDNVAPDDPDLDEFLNEFEALRDPTHVKSYRVATWLEWLEDHGFHIEETVQLSSTIEFTPWVNRISALTEEDKKSVRELVRGASSDVKEFFGITMEGDEIESFKSYKLLLRAVRNQA